MRRTLGTVLLYSAIGFYLCLRILHRIVDMQQMVRFLRGDLLIERIQDRVGLRRFDERAAIRFIEALGARLLLRHQSARLARAADTAGRAGHNLDVRF